MLDSVGMCRLSAERVAVTAVLGEVWPEWLGSPAAMVFESGLGKKHCCLTSSQSRRYPEQKHRPRILLVERIDRTHPTYEALLSACRGSDPLRSLPFAARRSFRLSRNGSPREELLVPALPLALLGSALRSSEAGAQGGLSILGVASLPPGLGGKLPQDLGLGGRRREGGGVVKIWKRNGEVTLC